jgi:thiol-disulfide isomerase/thioredoxin
MRALVPGLGALCVLSVLTACGGRSAPVEGAGHADRPAPSDVPDGTEPGPADGADAPEISLVSLDGKPSSFGAHRAPVTVVALWATYCAPCLRELPHIEALHAKYRADDDVAVLLVSVDDAEPDSRETITRLLRERSMKSIHHIGKLQQLFTSSLNAHGGDMYAASLAQVHRYQECTCPPAG